MKKRKVRKLDESDDVLHIECVEDFYVADRDDEVVSLAELPMGSRKVKDKFYLCGKTDDGLQPIMVEMISWKVQFKKTPCLFALTARGEWVRLGRPLKQYKSENLRSLLVLLHFLNLVRRNLDVSNGYIWKKLRGSLEVASEDDLLENVSVLKEIITAEPQLGKIKAVEEILKKSEEAVETVMKKTRKKRDEGDCICAICDDGGELLCCDGPCMRAFHGTKAAAATSTANCPSLCLRESEVKRLIKFCCMNCEKKIHQCVECGELGPSDGPDQTVFLCEVPLCGRFLHRSCANVDNEKKRFSCPVHRCFECGEGEGDQEDVRLYPCRRCSRAWHRECADLKFNDDGDDDDEEETRGWKMENARFLYCRRHDIVPELCTPSQDHLKFPEED